MKNPTDAVGEPHGLVSKLARLPGLLTKWTPFQRLCYAFFGKLSHSKVWRYTVQGSLAFGLWTVTDYFLRVHGVPETDRIFWRLLPAAIILFALILVSLPLAVFNYCERISRRHDQRCKAFVRSALEYAQAGSKKLELAECLVAIRDSVATAEREIYLSTPNGLYVFADRFSNEIARMSPSPFRASLEHLAVEALKFRKAISACPAPLYWIMPDPELPITQEYFENRERDIGARRGLLVNFNRAAARFAAELVRERRRLGFETYLCLKSCYLTHRILLVDGRLCFFQKFPEGKPALIEEKVHFVDGLSQARVLLGLEVALALLCEGTEPSK